MRNIFMESLMPVVSVCMLSRVEAEPRCVRPVPVRYDVGGVRMADRAVERTPVRERCEIDDFAFASPGNGVRKGDPLGDGGCRERIGAGDTRHHAGSFAIAADYAASLQLGKIHSFTSNCFVLVVDVEDNGSEQHEALDDLLVVDADTEDRHAVVHDAHDERADHGTGYFADAA